MGYKHKIKRRSNYEPVTVEIIRDRTSVNPSTGCWEWLGGSDQHGYGGIHEAGRFRKAHRVSFCLEYGIEPASLPSWVHVLHSCDNPPCVNPEHLFLGTPMDNSNDKIQKGRDGSHGRKLTSDQVLEIRSSNLSLSKLAPIYGVSPSTIRNVKSGYVYSHI